MSAVNVNISINTAPQIDRHQNEIHRGPIVNQVQNAQIAREDQTRRIQMPVQPDQIDGKKIDPEDEKKDFEKKKKKKRTVGANTSSNLVKKRPNNSLMVDLDA